MNKLSSICIALLIFIVPSFGQDSFSDFLKERCNGKTTWEKQDVLNVLETEYLDKNNFQIKEMEGKVDEYGNSHAQFQITFQGIPIEGSILGIHTSSKNKVNFVNGYLIEQKQWNTMQQIKEEEALEIAKNTFHSKKFAWESDEFENLLKHVLEDGKATFLPQPQLVYVPQNKTKRKSYSLAYKMEILSLQPLEKKIIYVDAFSGKVVKEIESIHHVDVAGTATTNFYGTQNIICNYDAEENIYFLEEQARNIETRTYLNPTWNIPTPFWNNNPLGVPITNESDVWTSDPTANEVHWATEQWYDYFFQNYAWEGTKGYGNKLLNVVHYGDQMNNAFWTGAWAVYGDGHGANHSWTSLDIVAHELTHGFIDATARFQYEGESGALSESFADIFATVIEHEVLEQPNWLIGEEVTKNGSGIRSLSDPTIFGHPNYYQGTNWMSGLDDHGGVHSNNGVQNYWFYLLSQDIGMDKAAQICFHVLRYYLTPYSQYIDSRNATLQAAKDIFGENSQEATAVCNHWNTVGVGDGNCQLGGQNITVVFPNGGETLTIGNEYEITWTSSPDISHVKIEFSLDGGENWYFITNNTLNDGSYIWNVPNIETSGVKIKISDASNLSVFDITDTSFDFEECEAIAEFSGTYYACINDPLLFTNQSVNANSFSWWIDDVQISTAVDLSHTFNQAGNYELELRADNNTCYHSFMKNIFIVDENIDSTFNFYTNGLDVTFHANYYDLHAVYFWDFGNGETGTGKNISFTYEKDSFYFVCLSVVNSCIDMTFCEEIIVLSESNETAGFCKNGWVQYQNNNGYMNELFEDNIGNIWARYSNVSLLKFDGSSWDSSLPPSRQITMDKFDNIWSAFYNQIGVFDGENWTMFDNSNSNLPVSFTATDIFDDDLGNIWIPTDYRGLIKYDYNTQSWLVYDTNNSGLPENDLKNIIQDFSGNYWIGTEDSGLVKFDGEEWTVYNSSNSLLPENKIYSLEISTNNILLIATNNGAVKYFIDVDFWDVINPINYTFLPEGNLSVGEVLKDTFDNVWLRSRSIGKFNGQEWERLDHNDVFLNSRSMFVSSDGSLWVTTHTHGVCRYNGNSWEVFNVANSNLQDDRTFDVIEDKNRDIWVATAKGISKIIRTIRPDFSSDISCPNDTSYFTNLSYEPTSNEWQINGNVVSTEQDLSYYFEQSGSYEITLIASDGTCNDVYTNTVVIPAHANELDLPEYVTLCGTDTLFLDAGLYTYIDYEWRESNNVIIDSVAITPVLSTGDYILSVIDSCGNTASDTIQVIFDEDCVWPGENNKDGISNVKDILNIGLAYGDEGTARIQQGTSWEGHSSLPWGGSYESGINLKHGDANGDGKIDYLDVSAIGENYNKTNSSYIEDTSLMFDNVPYSLVPNLVGVDPITQDFQISLLLQNNESEDIPFYGLAFSVLYETPSTMDSITSPFVFDAETVGSNIISLQKQFSTQTDIAFSRTDHINITFDNQSAARPKKEIVNYTIGTEAELPGGDTTLYIKIIPTDILMINNNGDTIPMNSAPLEIYLNQNFSFSVLAEPSGCYGLGSAAVLVSDTTQNYSYLWSNGSTEREVKDLFPGSYTVTVTSASGVELISNTITIEGFIPLSVQLNYNGTSITSVVNGGDGNYSYVWSTGETTPNLTNPISDQYLLTVIDGNGCVVNTTINLDSDFSIEGQIMRTDNSLIERVNVSLTGDASILQSTNQNFQINNLTTGVYEMSCYKEGDPSEDVSVLDGLYQTLFIENPFLLEKTSQIITSNLSHENDGGCILDDEDVTTLQSMILGNIEEFPVQKSWTFLPEIQQNLSLNTGCFNDYQYTYFPLSSDKVNQDWWAIKLGDVSFESQHDYLSNNNSIEFIIGSGQAYQGDTIEIPLYVNGMQDVSAFQLTHQWDNSVLEFVGIENININGFDETNLGSSKIEQGQLSVAWVTDDLSSPLNIVDGASAYTLKFKAIGYPGMQGTLNVNSSFIDLEIYDSEFRHFDFSNITGIVEVLACDNASANGGLTNIYVDYTATGSNDGSSWENAFTNLKDALTLGSNLTIHVAKGTYIPTVENIRGVSFEVRDNVTLKGGYPNGGGLRNPQQNITVLSGEIDGLNGWDGNSYHVVKIKDRSCVLLDGVTIKHGSANDEQSFGRSRGGGLYIINSEVNLNNVKIRWNNALYGGGFFASESSIVHVTNSDIKNNTANYGSAIYHSNKTKVFLEKSRIENNNSQIRCAIEVNNSLYTKIQNSLIVNNTSVNANAIGLIATNRDQIMDVINSTITGENKDRSLITLQIGFGDRLDVNLKNSILVHQDLGYSKLFKVYNNNILNLSTENCYLQGANVIGESSDNLFTSIHGDVLFNSDYSIQACSPAVDAGGHVYGVGNLDVVGNNRIENNIDIGAYEVQSPCVQSKPQAEEKEENSVFQIYPNPVKDDFMLFYPSEDSEIIDVLISDALGKNIFMDKRNIVKGKNVFQYSIHNLPPGIYFVSVQGISNSQIFKIVKQ